MALRMRSCCRVFCVYDIVASVIDSATVPPPVVAPNPSANQVDAVGRRTSVEAARRILDQHQAGINSRRGPNLIAEKLLLHLDGSGDLMWAEIMNGERVEVPLWLSPYRKTRNLLRPIAANAVAHHTTLDLFFYAESLPDRRSKHRALMDMLWINYLAEEQNWQTLFAQAMWMAMCTGFCPVHRYWREDTDNDWFESPEVGEREVDPIAAMMPGRGMIDCWVGSPFSTVFNRAAKLGSIGWASYDRTLPAHVVRRAFRDFNPAIDDLEGFTRKPTVSDWQNVARDWQSTTLDLHGSPVIRERRHDHDPEEELLTIIVRESAPGWSERGDEGRLEIVVVPGDVDFRRGKHKGHALLVADQPLPAGDFSFTNFYSDHRQDDIYGKPWLEDKDAVNVDLNYRVSKEWEYQEKGVEAPLVVPGGAIGEDMRDLGGLDILELEPSFASVRPRVVEWPQAVIISLQATIDKLEKHLFTIGGYQAVSRGEAPGSRMAASAIELLQRADHAVHGPVNRRYRQSVVDFAIGGWRQGKAFMDVDWLLPMAGNEYAYLVEPYVNKNKLSDRPPRLRLVGAFGASPEEQAEEIEKLVQMMGVDQQPMLTTAEARRRHPARHLFMDTDTGAVLKRRPQVRNEQIEAIAASMRQQGAQGDVMEDPQVQQAAQMAFQQLYQRFPLMRDDDLMAHLDALTELTQDESVDPIARQVAVFFQDQYYEWQAMQAGQMAPQQEQAPQGQEQPEQGGNQEVAIGSPMM